MLWKINYINKKSKRFKKTVPQACLVVGNTIEEAVKNFYELQYRNIDVVDIDKYEV